jgi:hypothetical protein
MSTHHRTVRRLAVLTATLLVVGAGAAFAAVAFSDVPAGHPHRKGITYVADAGITVGCGAKTFCPGDTLTRGQMATFLHRASGNDAATPPSVNAATVDGLDASELMPVSVHVTRGAGNAPVIEAVHNLTTTPSIVQFAGGYQLDLGIDVSGRFPQCTIDTNFVDTRDAFCTVSIPATDTVRVRIHDVSVGGFAPAEFWLTLHG